ncbi:MAG: DedA family protein [Burkholderiales bacterium]|nr:DedA family protein [Burkholderiales bacterium]
MELLTNLFDILLHFDDRLVWVVQNYGGWIYALLFLIVFCETGLVVTPFLPGDSLLFVAGTLAAGGNMDVNLVVALLIVAAIAGDSVNYAVGAYLGPKVFQNKNARWLKIEYLQRTQRFYERHGGKTIIIARFVPIIRTFAPFVAGIGDMAYRRFLAFNVIGAILWVASLTYLGYFFGNLPIVKQNFGAVVIGIIVLSILPGVFEYLKARRGKAAA